MSNHTEPLNKLSHIVKSNMDLTDVNTQLYIKRRQIELLERLLVLHKEKNTCTCKCKSIQMKIEALEEILEELELLSPTN